MSKFSKFSERARILYVEKQKTIATISQLIGVSEKSLHAWKKRCNWDQARQAFLEENTSCHESLFQLFSSVVKDATAEYKKTGVKPDKDTLNFIKAMVPNLPRIKLFEDLYTEQNKKSDNSDRRNEVIEAIDKYLTGQ